MAVDTWKGREFVIDVMVEITEDFSIALKWILGNPNRVYKKIAIQGILWYIVDKDKFQIEKEYWKKFLHML